MVLRKFKLNTSFVIDVQLKVVEKYYVYAHNPVVKDYYYARIIRRDSYLAPILKGEKIENGFVEIFCNKNYIGYLPVSCTPFEHR